MIRQSGILLHPTSLPGPYGIGDLGVNAYHFVDWLSEAGQTLWQVLPLGPTGYGDSPYASFSTFAGNPLLIGIENLLQEGYLNESETAPLRSASIRSVDFGTIIPIKNRLVRIAADRFLKASVSAAHQAFDRFCTQEAWWLDEYALFMNIKEHYDAQAAAKNLHGAMWSNFWPKKLALSDRGAIDVWKSEKDHAHSILITKVVQFFFFRQWAALKEYANSKGISIIGDLPIFVAADSVDVWSNRHLFQLDAEGRPQFVAGVPPDYFSATGQLWGNPLYAWDAHERDGFSWWIRRIQGNLRLFDWLRIDHFRGFESYWAVPADHKTAESGSWEKAPGHAFFKKLKETLGDLPILAEDLGFITEDVRDLRDSFGLPGMKILQFAFDAAESGKGLDCLNGFLPHMYSTNSVVYTGTHDNDTLKGWIEKAKPEEIDFITSYLGYAPKDISAALIRLALSSVSKFAVIPLQDLFGLSSESRMNTPSTLGNNWKWRFEEKDLVLSAALAFRNLSAMYGRNIQS